MSAIQFLHLNEVVHRDLKPENILLNRNNNCDIKIADFGFATKLRGPKSLTTFCGTPEYMAPEIYKRNPYDKAVDMWSVGVIIYIIIAAYHPFDEEENSKRISRIIEGHYSFPEQHGWGNVSRTCIHLIQSLLTVSVKKRLSAVLAVQHCWFLEK